MIIHSQIEKVIDAIKGLQKTDRYCCIYLKVAEIMITKLIYFILTADWGKRAPIHIYVKKMFQDFAIDSADAALIPPDTLKGNLDIFQENHHDLPCGQIFV